MPTGRHLFLSIAIATLSQAGPRLALGQDIPWSLPQNYGAPHYGAPRGPYKPQRRYDPQVDAGKNRNSAGNTGRNGNGTVRYGEHADERKPSRYNAPSRRGSANSGQPGPGVQYEWVLVPRGSAIPKGSLRGNGSASLQPQTLPALQRSGPQRTGPQHSGPQQTSHGHMVPSLSIGRIDQPAPQRKQFQLGDYPPLDRDPTLAEPPAPARGQQHQRSGQHQYQRQQAAPRWPNGSQPQQAVRQSWPYRNQPRQNRPNSGLSYGNYPTSGGFNGAGSLQNEFSGPSTFSNPYGYGGGGGRYGGFGHPFLSGLPRY